MPMSPYPVLCSCGNPAVFKVAACWSDGATRELKTYALTCSACLANHYANTKEKLAKCRLAPGESLEGPGVFELHRGDRDRTLKRRPDLETELVTS